MSAYTTIRISRMAAIALVLSELPRLDDHELAKWVNSILADRLYNCRIVHCGENDDGLL